MIRTLMLDVGDTLVKDDEALPFVKQSLAALQTFQIQDGSPLSICLVSDFKLAQPFTPQRVDEVFHDFLQLLAEFGLSGFFDPAQEKITLSTHANAFKPDRQVFELALQRLNRTHPLEESLFITENETHIEKCRTFGMKTLTFGAEDPEVGFDDWSVGLFLIADRLAADSQSNLQTAFPVWASAHLNCDQVSVIEITPAGRLLARGHCRVPVTGVENSGLEGTKKKVPANIEVELGEFGLPQEPVVIRPDEGSAA